MRLPRPDKSGLAMTLPSVIARSEATKQSPARNREGRDSFTPQNWRGSPKAKAGHYIQVITAYLASL